MRAAVRELLELATTGRPTSAPAERALWRRLDWARLTGPADVGTRGRVHRRRRATPPVGVLAGNVCARLLVDEQRARHMVRFLMDPLWRAYTVTLVEGTRLVGEWLDARPSTESVADRFQLLLREQFLPADLR